MAKLTDTQLVILSAAAQREGGAVLPLPKSLKTNKGAATGVLKSLLKQALIAERPATRDEEAWREVNDGKRISLVITDAGLKVIGVEAEPAPQQAPARNEKARGEGRAGRAGGQAPRRSKPEAEPNGAKPGTKMALLIDLLGRKNGVTIEEIAKATGWQAHSVRGAISGGLKKKLGLAVSSEKADGRDRVYRITAHR